MSHWRVLLMQCGSLNLSSTILGGPSIANPFGLPKYTLTIALNPKVMGTWAMVGGILEVWIHPKPSGSPANGSQRRGRGFGPLGASPEKRFKAVGFWGGFGDVIECLEFWDRTPLKRDLCGWHLGVFYLGSTNGTLGGEGGGGLGRYSRFRVRAQVFKALGLLGSGWLG